MVTKRIIVTGVGGVKLSYDTEYERLLSSINVQSLVDSDGYEVVGFEFMAGFNGRITKHGSLGKLSSLAYCI